MRLIGKVEKNNLHLLHEYDLKKYENEKVTIDIKKIKDKRSLAQNRYYWKVLINTMCKTYGDYDTNYIHHILKERFLKKVTDKGNVYIGSTTDLSVKEFWEYCMKVERLIMELGGEIDEIEYKSMREILKGVNYEVKQRRLEKN